MRDRPGGPDDPNSGDDPDDPGGPGGHDRPGSGDDPRRQPEQPRPGSWDAVTASGGADSIGGDHDWKAVLRSEGYDVDNFDFDAWGDDLGPDMSGDAPQEVEWHGDGGRYLSPEQHVDAQQEYGNFVSEVEPRTTPALQEVERASEHGAKLEGLEFRVKGADRFKEKVAEGLEEEPDAPAYEVAADLHDVVRYTYTYPAESYRDGVLADTQKLEDNGFEQVVRRNTWDSPDYKGVNSRWREPETGLKFEVQFHTPESLAAKEETHGLYERLRTPGLSREETDQLKARQQEITAGIPVPPGTEDIPDYSQKGR